jgi:hypothetical protein
MSPYRRLVVIRSQGLKRPPFWQRWLLAVAGVVLAVVGFLLGFVILSALVGVAALAALVIGVRVWWLQRRLRGRGESANTGDEALADWLRRERAARGGGGRTIDGESEDLGGRD